MLDCDAARRRVTFEELRDEGAPARRPCPGTAPFAEGGFPTPERPAAAARARSSPRRASTRWSATCRRTSSRTPSSPSATRWRCSRPPAASSSTRRSPRCPGTAARGPAARAPAPRRRGRARPRGRRARARAQRPRRVPPRPSIDDATRPGVAFTYKASGRSCSGPAQNVNADDRRARRRPRRRPDVPRQPRRGRGRAGVTRQSSRGCLQPAQAAREHRHDRERDLRLGLEQLEELAREMSIAKTSSMARNRRRSQARRR